MSDSFYVTNAMIVNKVLPSNATDCTSRRKETFSPRNFFVSTWMISVNKLNNVNAGYITGAALII